MMLRLRNATATEGKPLTPTAQRLLAFLRANPTNGELWQQRDLAKELNCTGNALNEAALCYAEVAPFTLKAQGGGPAKSGVRLWGSPEDVREAIEAGW